MEKSNCEIQDGQRFYVGNKSAEMRENKRCLSWSKAGVPLYESVGEHNYCRNPGKAQVQDWCFVKEGIKIRKRVCAVVTCGKQSFILLFQIYR